MLKIILCGCICFFWNGLQAQDVLTQHNDLNRTGWNPNETILNQSNVTPTSFGLLYKKTVDDQLYAQPLFVSGVMINGAPRNVVYVATVSNTVYAFDADDGTLDAYWQKNNTMAGKKVPNAVDVKTNICGGGYTDFQGKVSGQDASYGIVGTPVIDKSRNTIYFVARSRDLTLLDTGPHANDFEWSDDGFYQQFHALSLSTGNDTLGSPVNIDNSIWVPGTGDGADASNQIHFDTRKHNQRPGLVLYNNTVYVGYASHCDGDYYHGWVLGFSAANCALTIKYMTTPNDGRGGIWMSGAAPPVDAAGNFYFAVGNSLPNSDGINQGNMGLTVVKAKPAGGTFNNLSWFKPQSYKSWNNSDLDFGTGILLVPGADLMVTAHKSGRIVLLRKNVTVTGEYNESDHTNFLGYLNVGPGNESHSSISYYGGTANQFVYQFSEASNVSAYPVNASLPGLGTEIINSSVPTNVGFQGGFLSVSSNGSSDPSSILWVSHFTNSGGALHALKGDDVTQELWNSDALPEDNLGNYSKMNCVTVANGKVYAPTFSNTLNVYGLLSSNSRCITNIAQGLPLANYASLPTPGQLPASNAFDGSTSSRWAIGSNTLPQYLQVDLGSRFDICKVNVLWNNVNGTNSSGASDYARGFTIDISEDGTTWTTLNTVTGNSFTENPGLNEFNEHSTGRYVRITITQVGTGGTSISEFRVFGTPANNCIPPAGLAANPTQTTAHLSWMPVAGATQYIVKYKCAAVQSYITRVVPNTGNPVTLDISALTCGFNYTFQVQTDCGSGTLSNPASLSFTADNCSVSCTNAQHYSHGDLGDVKAAGSACYDGTAQVFTVSGAGNGLAGKGDQFQYEFKSFQADQDFVARVATQDQIAPGSNLAGVMMRDSITDISRFIFVGKTGDNSKIFMIYRASPGGTAVSMSIAKPAGADFFRILKSGTTFSAWYGTGISGPWTQVGTDQTITFVGPAWYLGMAVTSLNATTVSTATFDNFIENSTPLPVELINFSAVNMNDVYTSLKWQTAMEENSDHFDIERSKDGTAFEKILSVHAAGNSSILQTYNAVDHDPVRGINFYRLKLVDSDNRYTYSPVEIVKFGEHIVPVVYPNPVTDLFTAVPGNEPIREIIIYNMQGRAVQYAKGKTDLENMHVNIIQLSRGMYILKLKTDTQIFQVKIVKN